MNKYELEKHSTLWLYKAAARGRVPSASDYEDARYWLDDGSRDWEERWREQLIRDVLSKNSLANANQYPTLNPCSEIALPEYYEGVVMGHSHRQEVDWAYMKTSEITKRMSQEFIKKVEEWHDNEALLLLCD